MRPSPWGPLAVKAGAGDLEPEGGTGGTLVITDECVVLEYPNPAREQRLLIWPAERTSWDRASRAILFRKVDGQVVKLVSGVLVEVGLLGSDKPDLQWIARPASSCPTLPPYLVVDVSLR